jgi:hypothetical protein
MVGGGPSVQEGSGAIRGLGRVLRGVLQPLRQPPDLARSQARGTAQAGQDGGGGIKAPLRAALVNLLCSGSI